MTSGLSLTTEAPQAPVAAMPARQDFQLAAERPAVDLEAAQRAAGDAEYDELVLARDIPFRAVCEHHLLPFSGVAHVGYLPGERILGLSKLARLVEHFAARPQTQERLTRQVVDCLAARLRPRGAGAVLEAEHTCMMLRGVRSRGSTTVTSTLVGTLRADANSRAEFLALVDLR